MKYLNNYLIFILYFLIFNIGYSQNSFWKSSSGPNGAIINDIGVSKDSIIYIATEGQGLLKSADYGKLWKKIDDNVGLSDITSIAFGCGGAIFISGTTIESQDAGIYKSNDKGMTWDDQGLPSGKLLNYNNDTLFLVCKNNGVFRTFDNGNSWIPLDTASSTPHYAYDIARDMNGNLYISSYDIIIDKKANVFSDYSKGVYKSVDLGLTWKNLNNNIDVTQVCVNNSGHIIANGYYPRISTDIYHSLDNGFTWGALTGLPAAKLLMFFNESVLFAATENGIFKSESQGDTWQKTGKFNHEQINVIEKADENVLFAGSNYGILKSEDGGNTWVDKVNGFPAITIYTLLYKDGFVFCGGAASGIFLSNNGGDKWESTNDFFDRYNDMEIYSLCSNSNGYIFAGTSSETTLYYSDDYGATWHYSYFDTYKNEEVVRCLASDDSNYIYLGTDGAGVYISKNNGKDISYSGLSSYHIKSLYYDTLKNIIYAGTYYTDKICYSADKGNNWKISSAGLPHSPIHSISVYNNNIYAGTNQGIYVSTDSAATWQSLNSDLINTVVLSLYTTDEGTLYIGTKDEGILASYDNGAHFKSLAEGLASSTVFDIKEDNDHYIIAATKKGVNFSASPITAITEPAIKQKRVFALFKNYPNPFNPSTTIRYELPRQSAVTLKIYNIRGQKVKEYSYSSQNAGVHQLVWNGLNQYGAKAASGLYIINFRAEALDGNAKIIQKAIKVIMLK